MYLYNIYVPSICAYIVPITFEFGPCILHSPILENHSALLASVDTRLEAPGDAIGALEISEDEGAKTEGVKLQPYPKVVRPSWHPPQPSSQVVGALGE